MSDPRFGGQASRNLKMFQNLCGPNAYGNIVVLTTFWDRVSAEEGLTREEQLKSTFFSNIVAGGARFMRHDRTAQSAREVIAHILTLSPTDVQIQEEIRVDGKGLEETAAGLVHREEVELVLEKHRQEIMSLGKEISSIKQDNETLRRELEEEKEELQQRLAQWENEKADLKKGLDDSLKSRERLENQYRSVDKVRSATLEVLQVKIKEGKTSNMVVEQMSEEATVQRVYNSNQNGRSMYFYA